MVKGTACWYCFHALFFWLRDKTFFPFFRPFQFDISETTTPFKIYRPPHHLRVQRKLAQCLPFWMKYCSASKPREWYGETGDSQRLCNFNFEAIFGEFFIRSFICLVPLARGLRNDIRAEEGREKKRGKLHIFARTLLC